jgi:hypothetical protein
MGDPDAVVAILSEISKTMEDHRAQLLIALDSTFETLHSQYGMQWVMTLDTTYDVPPRRSEGARFPVAYQPDGYQPRVGEPAPYPRENTTIAAYYEEVIPVVQDAREAFRESLPEFERIGPGSIGDIDSLTQFPQRVAQVYDQWRRVMTQIGGLPADVRTLGALDAYGEGNELYGWSGPGASSYQSVVSDAAGASGAVVGGVKDVLTDLLSVVEVSVGVCKTLAEMLVQRLENLQSLMRSIEGHAKDPFTWLQIVETVADKAIELNRKSLEDFTKRLSELVELAELHKSIDEHFVDLEAAVGSGLTWPEPRAGMQARWKPGS